jgi:hypothetical protein
MLPQLIMNSATCCYESMPCNKLNQTEYATVLCVLKRFRFLYLCRVEAVKSRPDIKSKDLNFRSLKTVRHDIIVVCTFGIVEFLVHLLVLFQLGLFQYTYLNTV